MKVLAVRGAVVNVTFSDGKLPGLEEALVVEWDQPGVLVIEVQAHLDERTVRGVALQSTAGLKRGTPVHATGQPLTIPVGESLLGRLLDVMGEVQDDGAALPAACRDGPSTGRRPRSRTSPAPAIFETGIKFIDLLAPLARRQGGDVWRRRCRQDRLITEPIRAMVQTTRVFPFLPAWEGGRAKATNCSPRCGNRAC